MSELDPLRKAARVARTVPGYRRLRRVLVPKLRRNRALRTMAHRIWAVRRPGTGGRLGPSDVAAGSLLAGVGTENLAVVAVVVIGVEPEALGPLVDEVAAEQLVSAAFRPVFVMDAPGFGAVRRYSYVSELVVPAADWGHESPYQDYLDERFRSIRDAYGVATFVRVPSSGLDEATRAVLRSCAD